MVKLSFTATHARMVPQIHSSSPCVNRESSLQNAPFHVECAQQYIVSPNTRGVMVCESFEHAYLRSLSKRRQVVATTI